MPTVDVVRTLADTMSPKFGVMVLLSACGLRHGEVAELHRKFGVSAAETGSHDLHRRTGIGLAVVSGDRAHVVDVLDAAERLVAARPEVDLLSARRGLAHSDD